MRFYLGTGKYSPNAAVSGDMGWQPPSGGMFLRVTVMAESRFSYGVNQKQIDLVRIGILWSKKCFLA